MAGGELAAVFEGLAGDAGQAGGDIAESIAKFTETTADSEDANVGRILAADAENARSVAAIGKEAGSDAGTAAGTEGGQVATTASQSPSLSGAAGDPNAAGRDLESLTTAGDPVDVASGDVVLGQVDVSLAGPLPLVLQRTHRSSYRAGRWFGRSWASTLDQRLEVTADGLFCAMADGAVLCYPHPGEDGEPVLPVAGARWPLARLPGGSYTVTDPQGGTVRRFEPRSGHYMSAAGLGELPLVSVTDRAGHRITVSYDSGGAPARVSHDGGYQVRVEVAGGRVAGLVLAGAGPDGGDVQVTRYGYDEAGNLAEVVNSSGVPLRLSYDTAARVTGWQDRNGWWYRYAYDAEGRCVQGEGPDGTLSGRFAYDENGRVTTHTDAAGTVTAYELTAGSQVASVTDSVGNVTRSQHDQYGRLVSRTDPLGRVTYWSYDGAGNLTAITRPDGSQATASYNELGLPVQVTEPGGATWRQEFDPAGNLMRQVAPDGAVTEYSWDGRRHLAGITGPLGATTTVECDAAGLPVAITGPDGGLTRYERDGFGRVIAVTQPDGAITQLSWTAEGLLASRTLPDGAAERFSYDGEGNLIAHVDPAEGLTKLQYGCFDQVVARTAPDGTRTEFGYDHALRLTKVTHGGLTWRYEYDPAGRLVSETDYNGASNFYVHNAAGEVTRLTNGAWQQVTFQYDLLGNLAERNADGVVTTFRHDGAGRLVHATNPEAVIEWERDAVGRVTAETCNGHSVRSDYDTAGRRVRRVTPSGAETRWAYDEAGRPVELEASGHSIRFGYDQAGREALRELPGGLTLTQEWDIAGRLAAQILTAPSTAVQRRSYSYRADGCLARVDDLLSGTRRFALDPTGRVTGVAGSRGDESYAYDPAGNITAATWPTPPGLAASWAGLAGQGSREYSGTLITRAGDIRYEHDRAGRVTLRQQVRLSRKPDTWRYAWDSDNRLTAVTTPDGTRWRYLYDPLGRRIAKQRRTNDGKVAEETRFTWDGAALAEQATTVADGPPEQLAGAVTRLDVQAARADDGAVRSLGRVITWNYQPGTVTPLTQTERYPLRDATQDQVNERFYAIVTDLIGTPAEFVGADGDLAGYQRQTLWGTTFSRGAPTPLRFPGQYADPEVGLHYNCQRYYDPSTGRYLSPDPLGLGLGPNPHAYVPNPGVAIDPLGLMGCKITVSQAYQDWGTKGAHLKIDGMEVRVFPTSDGGIGAEGIRLRNDRMPSQQQLEEVLNAIKSDPRLRADLILKARSVMNDMNVNVYGMAKNRAAELHFLIKALEKMQ